MRKTQSECWMCHRRAPLHNLHWRMKDWRTLSCITFILSVATTILTTRPSTKSTGVSYTNDYRCPWSIEFRSRERESQATNLLCDIDLSENTPFRKCWMSFYELISCNCRCCFLPLEICLTVTFTGVQYLWKNSNCIERDGLSLMDIFRS